MPIFKENNNDLFVVFRLLCAYGEDFDESEEILSGASVSDENDECMTDALKDLLRSTLSSYPTSLMYDEMIYKYLEPNSETQLAVKIRIIEKTILINVLEQLEGLLN